MKNCVSGGKSMTSKSGISVKHPSQKRIAKLMKKKYHKQNNKLDISQK